MVDIHAYTRETVKWDKAQKAFVHQPSGDKFTGKGVSRFLYGYKPIAPSAMPAVNKGLTLHKQLETGELIHPSTIAIQAWLDELADKEHQIREAFLWGKLWGLKAVAFADCICYTKQKEWAIIDYKFSEKPTSMHDNTKWKLQLAYEAQLFAQTYGGIIPACYLVVGDSSRMNKPNSWRLNVIQVKLQELGQLLSLGKQIAKDVGVVK